VWRCILDEYGSTGGRTLVGGKKQHGHKKQQAAGHYQGAGYKVSPDPVGRCRLTGSESVLKAPTVSALKSRISLFAFSYCCFRIRLAALLPGPPVLRVIADGRAGTWRSDCLLIAHRCTRTRRPDCLIIVHRCTRTRRPDCLIIVHRCTRTHSPLPCLRSPKPYTAS